MTRRIKNGLTYTENLSTNSNICSKLEKNLFEGINQIRQNPREFQIIYYKNNFNKIKCNFNNSTELDVIHFLSKISKQEITFPPLQKLPELGKLSHEILTYINNLYIKTNLIDYRFFTPKNLTLRNRCLSYGHIKGKYFEGIIINPINYMQVINYIMSDVKGRKIIFDPKVKYIGISCDFLKNGEICTVIDIVQDFESNKNIISMMNHYNIKKKQIKNNYKSRNGKSADNIILKKINKRYTNIIPQNNFSLTFTSHFNKKKYHNKHKYIEPIASFKSISKIPIKISKSIDNEREKKLSINNVNFSSIFNLGREKNGINKNSENIDSKSNNISKINLSHTPGRSSRNGSRGRRMSQQEKIRILKQINESNRNTRSRNKNKISSKTSIQNINSNKNGTISLISSDNSNLNDNSLLRNIKLENEVNELKLEIRNLKQQISSSFNNDQQNSNILSYISSVNNQDKSKGNITKSSIGDNENTYKILLDKMDKGNERAIFTKKNKSSDYYKKTKISRKCALNMKKQNILNKNNKVIKIGKANCDKKSIGVYKHKSPIDRKMLSSNTRNGNNKMNNIWCINGEEHLLNPYINKSFKTEITLDKIIRVPKKIINNKGSFNYNSISIKNTSPLLKFNENKNTKFSIKRISQNYNIKKDYNMEFNM